MRFEVRLVTPILVALLIGPVLAQERGLPCLEPEEPYLGYIDKRLEPDLYEFARQEFQTYLKDTEYYLRCLEQQRGTQITKLQDMYQLFLEIYGDDAVFRYDAQQAND